MRIYVDADSCPVKEEVYRVARRNELEVTLVAAAWQRVPLEAGIHLEVVKDTGGLDAADDWIVERVGPGDVVVSDDILLAARCLEKEARVLSCRGRELTAGTVGEAVAMRELTANLREAGLVTGGPPPLQKADRSQFLQQLDQIVQQVKRTLG
jgi:uncharacterized protein YaiI (UPF0178 family)